MIKHTKAYLYLKYLRWKYFPSASQRLDKKYIEERLSFYGMLLHKGDLCFDVGANIGNRTEIFLKLGARVVAIEPQPACYKTLEIKFGKRISLIKEALGEIQGEAKLFISNTHEISSLSKSWIDAVSASRFRDRNWNKEINIKVNTLDNLISTYGVPAFCKIDVEGYEEQVLSGLSQRIPIISFEYTIPERVESIVNCLGRLSRLGEYECNFTIGETMSFVNEKWTSGDEILEQLKGLMQEGMFGDIYVRFKS